MSSGRRPTAIVFDGDDTLWLTQRHYDETIARFLAFLSSKGFRKGRAKAVFDRTDLANVAKFGFSQERFPRSMVDTYVHLSGEHGTKLERSVIAKIRSIGREVFLTLPELRPEARSVLQQLKRRHTLVLLTAGDPTIQRAKVRRLGMPRYFDKVIITPTKNAEVIREVLADLKIAPEKAVMVGNSLRSDIAPALEAGLTPIQILARGWHYDRTVNTSGHLKIRNLRRLPQLVGIILK